MKVLPGVRTGYPCRLDTIRMAGLLVLASGDDQVSGVMVQSLVMLLIVAGQLLRPADVHFTPLLIWMII